MDRLLEIEKKINFLLGHLMKDGKTLLELYTKETKEEPKVKHRIPEEILVAHAHKTNQFKVEKEFIIVTYQDEEYKVSKKAFYGN